MSSQIEKVQNILIKHFEYFIQINIYSNEIIAMIVGSIAIREIELILFPRSDNQDKARC